MSKLIYAAIPLFIITMLVEARLVSRARARRREGAVPYEAKDTRASITMGFGNLLASAAASLVNVPLYAFLYTHRFFELGSGPLVWVALLFAEDFTYYAWHRA